MGILDAPVSSRPNLIAPLFANQATVPVVMAHHCSRSIFPDESLEAAEATVALGIPGLMLDFDGWLLSDGAVGMMHDSTVDRTSTGTGTPATYDTMGWRNLLCDAGNWFAPGWGSTYRIPLWTDILDRWGGRVPISLEPKTALAAATVEVQKRRLEKAVLFNTNSPAAVATIQAAGIHACAYLTATDVTSNLAAFQASGADSFIVPQGISSANLSTIIGWGKPVIVTTSRRSVLAAGRTAGCAGVLADDPAYVVSRNAASATPNWGVKRYDHGMIGGETYWPDSGAADPGRPLFVGANGGIRFPASTNPKVMMQGNMRGLGPAKTYDFWVTFDTLPTDTTRYALMALTDTDEEYIPNNALWPHNGYFFLMRANGALEVYYFTKGGTTSTSLGTATAAAWTAGARRHMRVVVTSSQVSLVDVTSAVTAGPFTHNPSSHRPGSGWYPSWGKQDTSGTGVLTVDNNLTTVIS